MIVRLATLLLATAALLAVSADAQPPHGPYAVRTVRHGADGSYDYVSVDSATNRVFVGRSYGVMVYDPTSGKSRTLLARSDVASVLPIPATRLMLSTNAESATATLFNRDTGAVVADIATGKDPDGAYFDPASRRAFVVNAESEDLTMIDVAQGKAVGTIALGGKPEAATGDGKGRLFVNLEEDAAIAVVDIARRAVVGRYRLPGCHEPTGIAYDAASGVLVSACHNKVAKLIDARTGRDRGTLAIGAGADGALFDPVRRIGFIPCMDGTLTIYRLDRHGKASVVQVVRTREGARTAAYDTARDRVFLPSAIVERDKAGGYVRARADFRLIEVARR